jgi:hypothetical protein
MELLTVEHLEVPVWKSIRCRKQRSGLRKLTALMDRIFGRKSCAAYSAVTFHGAISRQQFRRQCGSFA